MVVITPVSEEAKTWVKENVSIEPWQRMGNGFAVDSRYVQDLLDGMSEEGLCFESDYEIFQG